MHTLSHTRSLSISLCRSLTISFCLSLPCTKLNAKLTKINISIHLFTDAWFKPERLHPQGKCAQWLSNCKAIACSRSRAVTVQELLL